MILITGATGQVGREAMNAAVAVIGPMPGTVMERRLSAVDRPRIGTPFWA